MGIGDFNGMVKVFAPSEIKGWRTLWTLWQIIWLISNFYFPSAVTILRGYGALVYQRHIINNCHSKALLHLIRSISGSWSHFPLSLSFIFHFWWEQMRQDTPSWSRCLAQKFCPNSCFALQSTTILVTPSNLYRSETPHIHGQWRKLLVWVWAFPSHQLLRQTMWSCLRQCIVP